MGNNKKKDRGSDLFLFIDTLLLSVYIYIYIIFPICKRSINYFLQT